MAALRYSLTVAIAILCGPASAFGEGTLDQIRSEVDEPAQNGSHDDETSGGVGAPFWADEDDDDSSFTELTAWVVIGVVTSPFTLPIAILDDEYIDTPVIAEAPYLSDRKGYLSFDESPDADRTWGARISIDGGGNFGALSTMGGRVQLEHQNRWGLDASSSHLGEHRHRRWDHLTVGDANLVYRFAQGESAQFYAGFGLNWLVDQGDFDAGFNVTYGADWFPVQPIVVSSTIDLGGLGGASLFRSRTTVGAVVERFEFYGGFDYLNVEGIDVPMGIAGLRLWF